MYAILENFPKMPEMYMLQNITRYSYIIAQDVGKGNTSTDNLCIPKLVCERWEDRLYSEANNY